MGLGWRLRPCIPSRGWQRPGSDSLRPPRPWLCSESPETQHKKRNLIRGLLFPRSGFPVPVHSEEAYPRPKPCLANEGKQVRANGLTTHYEPILTATSRVTQATYRQTPSSHVSDALPFLATEAKPTDLCRQSISQGSHITAARNPPKNSKK